MSPRSFGIEGITDEDRAYGGSRFSVVREALLANPYQRTWGARGEPPLPVHSVTLSSLLYGILPFGPPYLFRQATERAVDSAADLRWGPERKSFRRLVHPNGICLTGLWQINGRSDLSWEESVRLDLRYVENWSFAFDFVILWKTFRAVVARSGAY